MRYFSGGNENRTAEFVRPLKLGGVSKLPHHVAGGTQTPSKCRRQVIALPCFQAKDLFARATGPRDICKHSGPVQRRAGNPAGPECDEKARHAGKHAAPLGQ